MLIKLKLISVALVFLFFFAFANSVWAQGSTADPFMTVLQTVLDWIKTLGFLYCAGYVLGFIAAFLQLRWWTGVLLIVLIPVTFVFGLGSSLICNLFIMGVGQSIGFGLAYGICAVYCIIVMIYYAVMGFLPSIIAYRRSHPKLKTLFLVNFLGLLPLVWPVLLYFSLAKLEPES